MQQTNINHLVQSRLKDMVNQIDRLLGQDMFEEALLLTKEAAALACYADGEDAFMYLDDLTEVR